MSEDPNAKIDTGMSGGIDDVDAEDDGRLGGSDATVNGSDGGSTVGRERDD